MRSWKRRFCGTGRRCCVWRCVAWISIGLFRARPLRVEYRTCWFSLHVVSMLSLRLPYPLCFAKCVFIQAAFYSVVVAACRRYSLVDSRFNALLSPNFDLTVIRNLAGSAFIFLDRFRSLSVRRGPQSMPSPWPKVERCAVGHDLLEVRSQPSSTRYQATHCYPRTRPSWSPIGNARESLRCRSSARTKG